jgi:uncharacterized membrane protein
MTVAFAISGSWRVALGIGVIEPLVQTLFYTLHERLWGRLGRRPEPKDSPARAGLSLGPCPSCR